MWDVIAYPCPNFNGGLASVDVRAWMRNYISLFNVDVIIHPCHFDAILGNICQAPGLLYIYFIYHRRCQTWLGRDWVKGYAEKLCDVIRSIKRKLICIIYIHYLKFK